MLRVHTGWSVMSIAIPALKCIAILGAVMTRMIEYIRKIEIDLNLTYKSQISILWPDIIDLLQGASEIFCSLLEPRVHDRKKHSEVMRIHSATRQQQTFSAAHKNCETAKSATDLRINTLYHITLAILNHVIGGFFCYFWERTTFRYFFY